MVWDVRRASTHHLRDELAEQESSHSLGVNVDKSDTEIRFWVDGVDHGIRRVDPDNTIDCSLDTARFLDLSPAFGLVCVPPGRHTVKVQIVERERSLPHALGDPYYMMLV